MTDVVDAATRSRMMSGIQGRNTAPEMMLRRKLHALGLRYRLYVKTLPGKPDLVFPKWGVVVFIHGCFWHWHGCRLSKIPETRRNFWKKKLSGNRKRDELVVAETVRLGWRCAVVWECALRGKAGRENLQKIATKLAAWITKGKKKTLEIDGSRYAEKN